MANQGDTNGTGSNSNNNNATGMNESDEQSLFGVRLDDEALFAAAAAGEGEWGTVDCEMSFIQWLARLEVLDALRHVLQDGGALCINNTRKVEAMLILKVQCMHTHFHACLACLPCMHALHLHANTCMAGRRTICMYSLCMHLCMQLHACKAMPGAVWFRHC